jgi:hypothetical protein
LDLGPLIVSKTPKQLASKKHKYYFRETIFRKDYVKEIVDPSIINNVYQFGEKLASKVIKVTPAR